MNRRRFLCIAAAAAATPALAETGAPLTQVWQGTAMGSAARITLSGVEGPRAQRIFAQIARELDRIESLFSLHRDSALTRLNRDGRLNWPGADMLAVFALSDRVHHATGGAFDPTIQPLWQALARGQDPQPARALLGWSDIRVAPDEIRLPRPGMALSFNGVAQGYAADRIAALMRGAGLRDVLIDTGEISALGTRPDGTPWRARIETPAGAALRDVALRDRALAVSAPSGTRIGPQGTQAHILDPLGRAPRWTLAAVAAPSAALADALSTGLCVMDRPAIATALAALPDAEILALI